MVSKSQPSCIRIGMGPRTLLFNNLCSTSQVYTQRQWAFNIQLKEKWLLNPFKCMQVYLLKKQRGKVNKHNSAACVEGCGYGYRIRLGANVFIA